MSRFRNQHSSLLTFDKLSDLLLSSCFCCLDYGAIADYALSLPVADRPLSPHSSFVRLCNLLLFSPLLPELMHV